jgi:hypothetical protein
LTYVALQNVTDGTADGYSLCAATSETPFHQLDEVPSSRFKPCRLVPGVHVEGTKIT